MLRAFSELMAQFKKEKFKLYQELMFKLSKEQEFQLNLTRRPVLL